MYLKIICQIYLKMNTSYCSKIKNASIESIGCSNSFKSCRNYWFIEKIWTRLCTKIICDTDFVLKVHFITRVNISLFVNYHIFFLSFDIIMPQAPSVVRQTDTYYEAFFDKTDDRMKTLNVKVMDLGKRNLIVCREVLFTTLGEKIRVNEF